MSRERLGVDLRVEAVEVCRVVLVLVERGSLWRAWRAVGLRGSSPLPSTGNAVARASARVLGGGRGWGVVVTVAVWAIFGFEVCVRIGILMD